jgi:sugar phosphate isomerase/epimerase
MPNFGISIYSVRQPIAQGCWTPEDALAWMAARGAAVTEMVPFVLDLQAQPQLIDRCLRAAEEQGIRIDNFSQNAVFLRKDKDAFQEEMAHVKGAVDVAGRLGVSTMRIDTLTGRLDAEESTTAHFIRDLPTIVAVYKELCDYAAQYGITVLMENHMYYSNGAERVAAVVDAMTGYPFGVQLDMGNFVCVDERSEISVEKLLPFARVIHAKDFYIRDRSQDPGYVEIGQGRPWLRSVQGDYLRGAIFGQGDLALRRILSAVKAHGFDGSILIEYEGIEDPEYGAACSFSNLVRLWNEA